MNEADKEQAIDFMADRMEAGARFSGPGLHCITGDKTTLATRALEALMEHFEVTKKTQSSVQETPNE